MQKEPLTLQETAERLGVHYMTIYRYVRTGRLAASRDGGAWRVDPSDLEELAGRRTGPARRGSGAKEGRSRLEARLIAGDEAGAWDIVERALASGSAAEAALTGLVGWALEDIGDRWERGELSVADEHRASAVATRVVSRLGARFLPRGPKRGTVVVAAPEGELHSVPVSMAADVLRWHGFAVVDLGADTPADALAEAAGRERGLVAVGLACTGPLALEAAPEAVAVVHHAVPRTTVLVGGRAVTDAQHAARLGADHYTGRDAGGLLRTVEQLAGSRRV